MDPKERNQKQWEDPANWKGPFYFGEDDARVLVPKKRAPGYGWTFNLANTAGRLIFAGLIGVALAGVAFAIAFGGNGN